MLLSCLESRLNCLETYNGNFPVTQVAGPETFRGVTKYNPGNLLRYRVTSTALVSMPSLIRALKVRSYVYIYIYCLHLPTAPHEHLGKSTLYYLFHHVYETTPSLHVSLDAISTSHNNISSRKGHSILSCQDRTCQRSSEGRRSPSRVSPKTERELTHSCDTIFQLCVDFN